MFTLSLHDQNGPIVGARKSRRRSYYRNQTENLWANSWTGGVDLSMMPEAGLLDPADKTCREYERVVGPRYLSLRLR